MCVWGHESGGDVIFHRMKILVATLASLNFEGYLNLMSSWIVVQIPSQNKCPSLMTMNGLPPSKVGMGLGVVLTHWKTPATPPRTPETRIHFRNTHRGHDTVTAHGFTVQEAHTCVAPWSFNVVCWSTTQHPSGLPLPGPENRGKMDILPRYSDLKWIIFLEMQIYTFLS